MAEYTSRPAPGDEHPALDELALLLETDRDAPVDPAQTLASQHGVDCVQCRETLDALRATDGLLRVAPPAPPPELRAAMLQAARAAWSPPARTPVGVRNGERVRRRATVPGLRRPLVSLGAAAAVLGLVVIPFAIQQMRSEQLDSVTAGLSAPRRTSAAGEAMAMQPGPERLRAASTVGSAGAGPGAAQPAAPEEVADIADIAAPAIAAPSSSVAVAASPSVLASPMGAPPGTTKSATPPAGGGVASHVPPQGVDLGFLGVFDAFDAARASFLGRRATLGSAPEPQARPPEQGSACIDAILLRAGSPFVLASARISGRSVLLAVGPSGPVVEFDAVTCSEL